MFKLLFQAFVEIVFPYYCVGCRKKDTLLCSKCYEKIEFNSFTFNNFEHLEHLDEVVVVSNYQGIIKQLIHEFKYKSVIDIGKIIAKIIYRSSNTPKSDFIIPVPIHKTKKSKRGFNQSEEIAKELSKIINIPFINLLDKSRNTKSQMSIRNKDERKINVISSFSINKKNLKLELQEKISHPIALLIDDVITTGSTLNECAKILKENGIKKVIGVVFAQR